MKKTMTILNETGVHARPASMLVKIATGFSSDLFFEFNGSSFNMKSIMNLLSMGLKKGDEVTIVAEGSDEEAAVNAIAEAIKSKFGEA